MNRLKTTALAVLAGLMPWTVWALGLGEIQVNSKLNQALDAEISLLYDDEAEPQSTEVGLAKPEDFRRVGLDPSALNLKLDFQVQRNAAGRYVIAVTSSDVVTDPFVDFLIDVNWPNGRLLREYVVLLDPPVTPPSGPAEVAPAPRQPTSTPPRTTSSAAPVRSAGTTGQVAASGDYAVRRGDTLWEIARDSRGADITINQMMMALYRLNPDAFFEDNINALKAGAILRMPDQGALRDESVAQALSSVRTQNEAWESYRRSASGSTPVVSDQSADADYVQRDRSDRGRTDTQLKLVPPESGDAVATGRGGDSERLEGLRDQLARSREELVSSSQENTELNSRISDLENLVGNLERTISLKDADLADLQNQYELTREADADAGLADNAFANADTDAAPAGFDDELAAIEQELNAAAQDADDVTAPNTALEIDDTQTDTSTITEAADTSATEDVAQTPVRKQPGMMDKIMATAKRPLVWGSALGVAVLALIAGLLARRRGGSDDLGGDSLVDRMMAADQATSEMPAAMADLTNEADGADDGPDLDELQAAVAADPNNAQPHLALLRVHYAADDRDNFAAAAQQMHDDVGGSTHPAWLEVKAMGASLAPDHALFSGAAGLTDDADAEDDLSFDATAEPADDGDINLDFDAQPDDELDLQLDDTDQAAPADAETTDDVDELSIALDDDADDLGLDFDLDGDLGGESDSLTTDADADADAGGLDLDLDLDTLDLGEDAEAELAAHDEPGTDFELPAISSEASAETTAEINLDLSSGQDDQTREESATLAELEAADGELDDLGLDDLDLDSDELFGDEDAVGTKLDLAKAYIDMGDPEGAHGMLEEVIAEGSADQKKEAQALLDGL